MYLAAARFGAYARRNFQMSVRLAAKAGNAGSPPVRETRVGSANNDHREKRSLARFAASNLLTPVLIITYRFAKGEAVRPPPLSLRKNCAFGMAERNL